MLVGSPAKLDMGIGAIAVYMYNLNIRLYTVRIIMNASTVMNSPPISVTAHRGILSQNPTWLILSMIYCGSAASLFPDSPDLMMIVETIP